MSELPPWNCRTACSCDECKGTLPGPDRLPHPCLSGSVGRHFERCERGVGRAGQEIRGHQHEVFRTKPRHSVLQRCSQSQHWSASLSKSRGLAAGLLLSFRLFPQQFAPSSANRTKCESQMMGFHRWFKYIMLATLSTSCRILGKFNRDQAPNGPSEMCC